MAEAPRGPLCGGLIASLTRGPAAPIVVVGAPCRSAPTSVSGHLSGGRVAVELRPGTVAVLLTGCGAGQGGGTASPDGTGHVMVFPVGTGTRITVPTSPGLDLALVSDIQTAGYSTDYRDGEFACGAETLTVYTPVADVVLTMTVEVMDRAAGRAVPTRSS